MAVDISNLHDNYKILEPSALSLAGYPRLKAHAEKTRLLRYYDYTYGLDGSRVSRETTRVENYGAREAANLIHATAGHVTMKMLKVYEDGNEHHYLEVCQHLELAPGHDIDCWRSLEDRGLISFSSKRDHGKKFYRITDLGQEVLRATRANQVYFRVARWFKIKGEDVCTAMMKADLNGEESWKDLLPETLEALLEALFNPASEIHALGSVYRWMNNFMYLLKNNDEFYEKIDCPEVHTWLQANKDKYSAVSRFLVKFARIQKKRAKSLGEVNIA